MVGYTTATPPRPFAGSSRIEQALSTPVRLLLYGLAMLMPVMGWRGDFPLDDAYITMHNARALLQGWDATYGVAPSVGATSLVHLALEAGLGLVMPLPLASMAICVMAMLAYAIGLDRLVARAGAQGWVVPVLTLCGLLAGSMPILLVNGLETGIACAMVVWLLLLDRSLPLLAGVSIFVRPELAFLAMLALGDKMRVQTPSRRVRSVAMALAVAVPFLAWNLVATGQPLPGTMAAKVAFFRETGWPVGQRLEGLIQALRESGFVFLLPGLVGLRDWRAWGFLVTFVGGLMALLPGSVGWNDMRYLGPLVPVAILGLAQMSPLRTARYVIAVLALCVSWHVPRHLDLLTVERWHNAQQAIALRSSLAALAPGSRVLIHDAGLAAWVAPQMQLIDVVGLKTPTSIAIHQAMTQQACHWGQALDSIAQSSGAQYAVVLEQPFWRCTHTNLADQGWHFTPLPSYGGAYRLYPIGKAPEFSPPVLRSGTR